MDDDVEYAGRLLDGRYRLPRAAEDFDSLEPFGTRAYDTASGQEVLARRLLLPEVVDAEILEAGATPAGPPRSGTGGGTGRATRRPSDPAVRRAVEAALAASRIPDHPRLDQVYDAFVEGDELWVISELLPARPLSELLAHRPLGAHRAAEIAADVLAALRAVHAHGWVHRNITARTVMVCDDGRAVLTGLATGAAQEALCGNDPLPDPSRAPAEPRGAIPPPPSPGRRGDKPSQPAPDGLPSAAQSPLPAGFQRENGAGAARGGSHGASHAGAPGSALPQQSPQNGTGGGTGRAAVEPRRAENPDRDGIFGFEGTDSGGGPAARAARRGAIAAYRAGAQAAYARVAAEMRHRAGDGQAGGPPSGATEPEHPTHGHPTHGHTAQGPPEHGRSAHGHPAPDPHGPAALPGPREGESRPVPTPWSAPATEPPHPEAEAEAEAGPGPGAEARLDAEAGDRYRGPTTSLAAERARQARMAAVGAVTERWAPEQAGPVYENWRLAPPVGPAADLWALGALLFRAVQGHAPYPEEDVAELVRMVCAEPPAFAEECGPLRPVVESLLRQDPTERPDFEVLRGWLRSLIRSAPEPDVGRHTLTAPPSLEPGRPADPRRLPIVRRRGELVRRRRAGRKAAGRRGRAPGRTAHAGARRTHRQAPSAPPPPRGREGASRSAPPAHHPAPPRPERGGRGPGSPRRLGRLLLGGVLLLLTAAVLYAMWFLPKRDTVDDGSRRSSVGLPEQSQAPTGSAPDEPAGESGPAPPTGGRESPAETRPQTSEPAAPAEGFRMHEDPTGFRIAVPEGWDRSGPNARGQVRFDDGDFEMVVVKGRDSTEEFGADPMAYQSDGEPELEPFRTSDWSSASGLRRIDVGDTAMAEGTFTWQDSSGRDVYVRNRAMILDGRYHLVLVIGPDDEREAVDRWFEGAVDTYRVLR